MKKFKVISNNPTMDEKIVNNEERVALILEDLEKEWARNTKHLTKAFGDKKGYFTAVLTRCVSGYNVLTDGVDYIFKDIDRQKLEREKEKYFAEKYDIMDWMEAKMSEIAKYEEDREIYLNKITEQEKVFWMDKLEEMFGNYK